MADENELPAFIENIAPSSRNDIEDIINEQEESPEDSSLFTHAIEELNIVLPCDGDMNDIVRKDVLELLKVFSKQGQSGFSAPYVINLFSKLAKFEALAPIEDVEEHWMNVDDRGTFQHRRCGGLFKKADGKCHYIDAVIWKTPTGSCFGGSAMFNGTLIELHTKIRSSLNVKFPFTPKTFYIDVLEEEVAKDDWEFTVKNINDLMPVWNVYEMPDDIKEYYDTIQGRAESGVFS